MDSKKYKIDDIVIARIAQMIQEAMLFGYDVTDNFRTLTMVEASDGQLTLDPEYLENVKKDHEALLAKASELQAESKETQIKEQS